MSRGDVEIVRDIFKRWDRGDFDTAEVFHPQVEFARYGGEVGIARDARGLDALTAAMVEWMREWTGMRLEAERFLEAGDRVLVLARLRGTGKRSGLKLDHLEAEVFTVRDGKIVRWEAHWDPAEAMRSVGLEPQ
jgi:ketosteroid isomerase-like protein